MCRDVFVLATAAARDATNGPAFLAAASEACGQEIALLLGRRGSAALRAWACSSGFHAPDGLVGDMGGGSLELVDVDRESVGEGVTMPLGGLALQDMSGGSLKKAQKIIRAALERAPEYLARLQWAARSTQSAGPGARWRAFIRRRPIIRCM